MDDDPEFPELVATFVERRDDRLTLAREGETVEEREEVSLADLVADGWHNVATGRATLVTETDRHVPADRSRLKQLLENPIGNSVEHGSTSSRPEAGDSVEHGGVTVTVGNLDDGSGFYVADDGPGLPEGDSDLVFESGHPTAESGPGFGLAIVEEVASAHGSTVRATASVAGGARFEITGVEPVG